MKVMVVDDQVLLKQTLIFMLEQDKEIEAMDGGSDGFEAIENAKKMIPDVILMDLRMPKLGGLKAIQTIKEEMPYIKIMVLTTFEDHESIMKSLEYGADGYLVKDIKPEELILAVKSVVNNLYVMHVNVLNLMKEEIAKICQEHQESIEIVDQYELTSMEIQIIRLMVDGKSNREIATLLNFSEGTIKNKISRLFDKLDLKDRTQIAVFALKHNII